MTLSFFIPEKLGIKTKTAKGQNGKNAKQSALINDRLNKKMKTTQGCCRCKQVRFPYRNCQCLNLSCFIASRSEIKKRAQSKK